MKNTYWIFALMLVLMACNNKTSDTAQATETPKETTELKSPEPEKAPKKEVLPPPSGDYTGTWAFEITGTPEGDFSGDLVIGKEGDGFIGNLVFGDQSSKLSNVVISGNKLSFDSNAGGYNASTTGNFEGDVFNGKVEVEGYEFPFIAKRK